MEKSGNVSGGDPLLDRVSRYIDRHELVRPGDLVLAGISGGPDSLFMLAALSQILPPLRARLHVVHLNHCLRGQESDDDAEFVALTAASLGLGCTIEKRAIPSSAADGVSLQERARSVRLSFFREKLQQLGGNSVALAHTADDQTETMLLRFMKGGGPGALAGIRPRGPGGIVHPILEVTRGEILGFLEAEGLSYRTDSSNSGDTYLRNRIRHTIVPGMIAVNPSLHRRSGELALLLSDEDDCLTRQALDAYRSARLPAGDQMLLDAAYLARLPRAICRRVLVLAAVEAGVSRKEMRARHVEGLLRLVAGRPGGSSSLPGRRQAFLTTMGLTLPGRPPARPPAFERSVCLPGETRLPEIGMRLVAEAAPPPHGLGFSPDPMSALVDADALAGGLLVRSRRPGDRFIPLGMAHHQKLQDFLVNLKIDRARRDAVPVLCDEAKIIWLGGLRIDERARITDATRRAWRLRLVALAEPPRA